MSDLLCVTQLLVSLQVRSLWSTIDGVLSNVEEERRVVECVIRGDVDQYILDGSDLSLKIPKVLLERIERLSNHVRGEGWCN